MNDAKLITDPPIVVPIASMSLMYQGLQEMVSWLQQIRPECLPESLDKEHPDVFALFPHGGERDDKGGRLTGNELLVELCGRKCYNSFGLKAGRKSNEEYIEHTQGGDIPHASILYQAKMTFFIAGISRRVSHELIRNYVGSDREEEGNPSQESTRYVEHSGRYIVHPGLFGNSETQQVKLRQFKQAMELNYRSYREYIENSIGDFRNNEGREPQGMDRKRIYESASSFLSHAAETSFIWTTNPIALAKLIRERQHEAADLEFQRLARTWKAVALLNWPNLFPQPWMQS